MENDGGNPLVSPVHQEIKKAQRKVCVICLLYTCVFYLLAMWIQWNECNGISMISAKKYKIIVLMLNYNDVAEF